VWMISLTQKRQKEGPSPVIPSECEGSKKDFSHRLKCPEVFLCVRGVPATKLSTAWRHNNSCRDGWTHKNDRDRFSDFEV